MRSVGLDYISTNLYLNAPFARFLCRTLSPRVSNKIELLNESRAANPLCVAVCVCVFTLISNLVWAIES